MRYFIVHTAPKKYIEKYQTSISGGLFSYNLIGAGIFDKVYSILPSNVCGYSDELEIDNFEIIYSKIRNKTFLFRILGCIIEQVKVYKKIPQGSSVWLYNICILNCVLYKLLRLFKPSVKIFTIMADFTPGEKMNDRFLPMVNKSDGLITLSDSNLFTNKNKVILPGIVPTDVLYSKQESPLKRNFLISGALKEEIACISMLLDAFSEMPEIELNISGRFKDLNKMKSYTDRCQNIKYHGVVSFDEFKRLLDNNTFVLSTRDPSYPENQCNFPSKILEALLHNRIIISSIHYVQLEGVNYFEVPVEKNAFKNAIREIMRLEDKQLISYANQADVVMENFSAKAWLRTVIQLESSTKHE